MKTKSRRINLLFNGDFYAYTTQSKTCREAVLKCIESLETKAHSLGSLGFLDEYILKHKNLLTAKFAITKISSAKTIK